MRKRSPRDWHPEDIKAAVRKTRYGSLAALSLAYGLPEHACRHACRSANFHGEMAIAEALDRSPREIWPSRYDSRRPRFIRSPAQPTAPAVERSL
ncbi:helix-turn-helix domain-containing protein [Ancylobacter dichloromethanicus]|uniref:helix-turn-helix domain-containing protein n=1 Tax=Ancylobacter dichloromethanicus TaxID=518825 RepID=UPI001BD025E5|nr:helix-turn-helix domain-containing protein [Ancylobacter dichloromethanicus]